MYIKIKAIQGFVASTSLTYKVTVCKKKDNVSKMINITALEIQVACKVPTFKKILLTSFC